MRLPVSRRDRTEAQTRASTSVATQFMDSGWLIPQQKPTTAIDAKSAASSPVTAARRMAGVDAPSAAVSSAGSDASRVSAGIAARETIDSTERVATRRLTTSGEMPWASPTTGM